MTEESVGVVHVDGYYASAWPEVKESLGLNPAGPEEIEGIEVLDVETSEDGCFTHAVRLRFESPEVLKQAKSRLFDQAEEMGRYGIHDDAKDVQDFAFHALPMPSEVFDRAE